MSKASKGIIFLKNTCIKENPLKNGVVALWSLVKRKTYGFSCGPWLAPRFGLLWCAL